MDGYYDGLLSLFDKAVEEGFIEDSARHIFVYADSPEELIEKLESKRNEINSSSPNKITW